MQADNEINISGSSFVNIRSFFNINIASAVKYKIAPGIPTNRHSCNIRLCGLP